MNSVVVSRIIPPADGPRLVWTVDDVVRRLREIVRGLPRTRDLWVGGTVGDLMVNGRDGHGHWELTSGTTAIAVFDPAGRALRRAAHRIGDGSQVIVHGELMLYRRRARVGLRIDQVELAGVSPELLARRALEARLATDGLLPFRGRYFDKVG